MQPLPHGECGEAKARSAEVRGITRAHKRSAERGDTPKAAKGQPFLRQGQRPLENLMI